MIYPEASYGKRAHLRKDCARISTPALRIMGAHPVRTHDSPFIPVCYESAWNVQNGYAESRWDHLKTLARELKGMNMSSTIRTTVLVIFVAFTSSDTAISQPRTTECSDFPDGPRPLLSIDDWWSQTPTRKGVKGKIVSAAVKALAKTIKHGGKYVSKILRYLDDEAATAFDKYSKEIAKELNQIAKIPDLTTVVVKEKLLYFLTGTVGLGGGTALQIADAVKAVLDWIVF